MEKIDILTKRKIYRDDIANDNRDTYTKIASDMNLRYEIKKANEKGEFVRIYGDAPNLEKITIQLFGKDLNGEFSAINPFVAELIELNKNGYDRFNDCEEVVISIIEKYDFVTYEMDDDWKGMVVNDEHIGFMVSIKNALPNIIKSFYKV